MRPLSETHEELREHGITVKIEIGGRYSPSAFISENRSDRGYIGCYSTEDIEEALSDIPALAKKLEENRINKRCNDAIEVLTANGYEVRKND